MSDTTPRRLSCARRSRLALALGLALGASAAAGAEHAPGPARICHQPSAVAPQSHDLTGLPSVGVLDVLSSTPARSSVGKDRHLAPLRRLVTNAGDKPGLAEMRAFAERLLVNEQYPEAINAYIAIVEQTPEDPRSRYDVAGAMVFLRMYPDAVPHIEKAVALDPKNVLYLELAALTYAQLRQHENAFEATRRGAELGDIKAMYTLVEMYRYGRGTSASPARALEWLARSADAGHMGAMDDMARVYRDGLYGEAPDPERVEVWNRKLERALTQ